MPEGEGEQSFLAQDIDTHPTAVLSSFTLPLKEPGPAVESGRMKMKEGKEDGHHHHQQQHHQRRRGWNIQASCFAEKSINPIRQIVENMNVDPNPSKPLIPLSIGDPTLFGNLRTSQVVDQALIQTITSGRYNGYLPSNGLESGREAIADYVSVPGALVDPGDVFITSGASHALDLCISLLGSPGSNILIPRPGFPLYRTLCASHGIDCRPYDLIPDQEWRIDLNHMRSQVRIFLYLPTKRCITPDLI